MVAMMVIACASALVGRVARRGLAAVDAAERATASEAWEKAAANAMTTAAKEDAEIGEGELVIGDAGVAYVARGWNAERRLIGEDKIEAIWEGPAAENERGELEATPPKGALLVLHGCHHSARDWFANNTKCESCRGLAQEMSITRMALARGYVVIAVSSFGTCWSESADVPRVEQVLNVFFNETALTNLPLYAFGASSGGSFVGLLPQLQLPVKPSGLIIQIAPGPTLEHTPRSELSKYPPTVFSHMPRDSRTGEFIGQSIGDFKKAGVLVKESPLRERIINDDYFYRESFGKISEEESASITGVLRSFNMLDANGKLTEDPRSFDDDHVDVLKRHSPEWDSLLPDQSDIRELLNVAYATHELSAETFARDFRWLIQQSSKHVR